MPDFRPTSRSNRVCGTGRHARIAQGFPDPVLPDPERARHHVAPLLDADVFEPLLDRAWREAEALLRGPVFRNDLVRLALPPFVRVCHRPGGALAEHRRKKTAEVGRAEALEPDLLPQMAGESLG